MDDKFGSLLKRLEAVTVKLEAMPAAGAGAAAGAAPPPAAPVQLEDDSVAPMVAAFDAFISGPIAEYVAAAKTLDLPETAKQADLVKQAFDAQRAMLVKVSKCKKPTPAEVQEAIKETSELLGQVQGCATSDRRAADYNHRQAMSEAIPAMGWVMVEKTPGPHINDMWDCGAFNQQKIVVEHKGKNENHVTFAKAMKAIFTELGAFVKEHHRTGLEWNPKGINQGGAITAGLKKVKKGEDWDPAAYGKKKPAAPSSAPKYGAAAATTKPPKLALNGKKWECEFQVKQSGLEIEADVKQAVYVYKCTDSVLTVKGKCNTITLDGCKKVAIVFDSVVAGIELINCQSCKVQVKDIVSTVTVDSCNGTQVILNRASLSADVVSAKSSELNIVVPGENENDEFKEFAIPEQFISKWNPATNNWTTVSMAHTG